MFGGAGNARPEASSIAQTNHPIIPGKYRVQHFAYSLHSQLLRNCCTFLKMALGFFKPQALDKMIGLLSTCHCGFNDDNSSSIHYLRSHRIARKCKTTTPQPECIRTPMAAFSILYTARWR